MEVKREVAASPSPSPSPSPQLPPQLPPPPPSTANEIFGLKGEEVIEKVSPTSDCQTGTAQNVILDGKHQESPSKRPTTHMEDERSTYLSDPTELGYFGSSVHYGGRDFYTCSQSTTTSNAYTSYEEDDLDNSHFATRGNWWQGSLYY